MTILDQLETNMFPGVMEYVHWFLVRPSWSLTVRLVLLNPQLVSGLLLLQDGPGLMAS